MADGGGSSSSWWRGLSTVAQGGIIVGGATAVLVAGGFVTGAYDDEEPTASTSSPDGQGDDSSPSSPSASEPASVDAPTGPRYVVVLINEGHILSVRRSSSIASGMLRSCDFRHGGICDGANGEPLGNSVAIVGDPDGYESPLDATEAACAMLDAGSFGSPPLAAGFTATLGGENVTVDDWGSIDIGRCREVVNG